MHLKEKPEQHTIANSFQNYDASLGIAKTSDRRTSWLMFFDSFNKATRSLVVWYT